MPISIASLHSVDVRDRRRVIPWPRRARPPRRSTSTESSRGSCARIRSAAPPPRARGTHRPRCRPPTSSRGQGLPIAVGEALAAKRPLNAPFHVWTLTGDSELAEGSIWEGLDHAGHEGLSNFTAIFDINRLGQRGPTELEWNVNAYAA